ncbi:MAG: NAD(P)H-dependent oxidoreductase subunit E [Bacteroidales bacterium]|nr:NAD(P)H-dependent oxidoreductase subunit E [Bacteroidales bacterium]
MDSIAKILERYPFVERENLIPILQEIQQEQGYLTEEAVREVGRYLNLPASKIYSLATFYNRFRFHPLGSYHIRLCRGTSCQVHQSGKLEKKIIGELGIEDGQTTTDGLYSLEVVSCMGACGMGPVMAVNNRYYTGVTEDQVEEIIAYYRETEE